MVSKFEESLLENKSIRVTTDDTNVFIVDKIDKKEVEDPFETLKRMPNCYLDLCHPDRCLYHFWKEYSSINEANKILTTNKTLYTSLAKLMKILHDRHKDKLFIPILANKDYPKLLITISELSTENIEEVRLVGFFVYEPKNDDEAKKYLITASLLTHDVVAYQCGFYIALYVKNETDDDSEEDEFIEEKLELFDDNKFFILGEHDFINFLSNEYGIEHIVKVEIEE